MITAQPGSGPTVLRILLGSQLRRLREAKGVTRVKFRLAFTDSGCAPSVHVAVGCSVADAASRSKGGAESKGLSWRVLPGLLAVRS